MMIILSTGLLLVMFTKVLYYSAYCKLDRFLEFESINQIQDCVGL